MQSQYRFVCECICAAYTQMAERDAADGDEEENEESEAEQGGDSGSEERSQAEEEEEEPFARNNAPPTGDHSDGSSVTSSVSPQPPFSPK